MLVVVRATQAAAHRSGSHINADLTRLVLTAETAARAAVSSPQTWKRLRAYRDPYRGCACALAASKLGLDEMVALTVESVEADGSAVLVDGAPVAIHSGAQLFVRARRLVRVNAGATGGAPLLADETGAPMRRRVISAAVRVALLEVGVAIASQRSVPTRTDGTAWMSRWGLSVGSL